MKVEIRITHNGNAYKVTRWVRRLPGDFAKVSQHSEAMRIANTWKAAVEASGNTAVIQDHTIPDNRPNLGVFSKEFQVTLLDYLTLNGKGALN